MILFLYGAEPFLVREKLAQIVDKALSQGVDEANRSEIDGTDATIGDVTTAIQAMPFIAPQRLVVIRDWLVSRSAEEADELVAALGDVPETTIVVVAEFGKPDARRSSFKKLKELAQKTWEFAELDEPGAVRWVQRAAADRGTKLNRQLAATLVDRVGVDLWALSTELDKLRSAGELTAEKLAELTADQLESDVFALVDALGQRKAPAALSEYRRLVEAGEEPLRILAMVVRQYRILIAVQSLVEGGATDATVSKEVGAIVNKTGKPLHPFVVKKAKDQAGRYAEVELYEIYDRLAQLDLDSKTGRVDADTGLELFIVEACGVK